MSGSELLSRRTFLQRFTTAVGVLGVALFSDGCSQRIDSPVNQPEGLDNFASSLPRQVGETIWNGDWITISGATAQADVEAYLNPDNKLRHRINLIRVITSDTNNRVLTLEQQKAVFTKEVNHLYSYNFIDTTLADQLDLSRYPMEEVHVLADGLAALKLTLNEQKSLYLNYSQPVYNHFPAGHPQAGKPYYPDLANLNQSVLRPGEYVVWDGKTLTLPMLAAIDIMSTRMKVIDSHGIKAISSDLFRLIQSGSITG